MYSNSVFLSGGAGDGAGAAMRFAGGIPEAVSLRRMEILLPPGAFVMVRLDIVGILGRRGFLLLGDFGGVTPTIMHASDPEDNRCTGRYDFDV